MNEMQTKNSNVAQKEQPRVVTQQRRVTYTPQADILELPDELVLLLDLPGVKAGGVELHFERGELAVRARREHTPHSGESLVEEFEAADYYRAFLVSQDVAPDRITAELKNGVLTVHLPKAAAAQPRRITVKGS